jgi:hypothetical protein
VADVIPFVLEEASCNADCGYAFRAWVVDLLYWAWPAPLVQRQRILGLLVGYDSDFKLTHYRYADGPARDGQTASGGA